MIPFALDLLYASWIILAEFAPYLLFGFSVAGLLHFFIPQKFIVKQLGKSNFYSVFKAAMLGIPLPLCSCSVIPVASSIKKEGASRGATISFLSSTPQTGIDSILATYGLFGFSFTFIKVVVALMCGLVSGVLVDLFCDHEKNDTDQTSQETNTNIGSRNLKQSLNYFFTDLPIDLYKPLLIGILIAGLINNLLPSDFFTGSFSSGWAAFIGITLISLPLYVCAIESLPLAFAFLSAGISPGAVLVFLIVGPATNSATIMATLKIIGKKATLIYILTLVVIAWISGYITNNVFNLTTSDFHIHEESIGPWNHFSGVLLSAYFLNALINDLGFKKSKKQKQTKPTKQCH